MFNHISEKCKFNIRKKIYNFTCVYINNLFNRFAINKHFLKVDLSNWDSNGGFQEEFKKKHSSSK